jgi:hypothetical protein
MENVRRLDWSLVLPRTSSLPGLITCAALVIHVGCGGDQSKRAPEPDGNHPDGSADPGRDGSSGGPHDSGDGSDHEAGSGEGGPHDSGDGTDSGGDALLMAGASIEVGRVEWGNDYAGHADAPSGGTLFSIWTKVADPAPTSFPWVRANMDVYVLYGANWHFRCLTGNMSANSALDARYAANTMLFAGPAGDENSWVEDYGYYESGLGNPLAPYRDWVWAAWWIVVGDDDFTVRQWLKIGVDGPIIDDRESSRHVTFAEARDILVSQRGWSRQQADAWVPGDATGFNIGYKQGYVTHARMAAQSTAPTHEELQAIALHNVPDASAWADYAFVWTDDGPFLRDQSGHGRHLEVHGTLYPGPAGPSF